MCEYQVSLIRQYAPLTVCTVQHSAGCGVTKVISVCRAEDSSPLTDRVRDDITLQV